MSANTSFFHGALYLFYTSLCLKPHFFQVDPFQVDPAFAFDSFTPPPTDLLVASSCAVMLVVGVVAVICRS